MRILLAHHGGSYAALPPTVCATLLELDSITQTDVIRKKMKFLGHLPLTGASNRPQRSCRKHESLVSDPLQLARGS